MAYEKRTGTMSAYFVEQLVKRNEPVMQFFLLPFMAPVSYICDGREASDVMTHRIKEFDRSRLFGDLFVAYMPHSSITFPTDNDWKYNRSLISETMLPRFLEASGAKQAYGAFKELVSLWQEKARLADDRAIDVAGDTRMAAMDAIWAMTFGSSIDTCKTAAAYFSKTPGLEPPTESSTPQLANLPSYPHPPIFESLMTLLHSSRIAMSVGHRAHWLAMSVLPSLRKAKKIRDKLVRERLSQTYARFASKTNGSKVAEKGVASAIDIAVQREITVAAKEGRLALNAKATEGIHNELCLFLAAGSAITADTISWGLKRLTAHQDVQAVLRAETIEKFQSFDMNGVPPIAEAIATTDLPQLDAFIEEVLRCHPLGNSNNAGPSLLSIPFPISDQNRSPTSLKSTSSKWDHHSDLETFRPDRWLIQDSSGSKHVKFDPSAYPMQTFGEGPRSCFGKKFAYLEMRIALTLILWNFELLPIPEELVDFDIVEELTRNARHVRLRLKRIS
ncbi:hypothetical protein PRZ48_013286 [Zasmidium cellare]|uniref:Cytochrome P450 n=1 Tax=Zasmidium cellare TaxID=395010 RepID=A0ABR0E3L5_ZASCE|nr:hypothetical protein PRZ48_013286 [Zasmidium cellare]